MKNAASEEEPRRRFSFYRDEKKFPRFDGKTEAGE